jgi:hypothetical protein
MLCPWNLSFNFFCVFVPCSLKAQLKGPLDMFPTPSLSIPTLEAAVRHDWGPTATSSTGGVSSSSSRHEEDAKAGLEIAVQVIVGVTLTITQSDDQSSNLVQHVADSSKSPALLSLLLSCMKRLQGNCERMPYRVAAVAAGAAELAGELAGLCSAAAFTASISTVTGPTHSSNSTLSSSSSSRVRAAALDNAASTWLVLFGRSLYTTGAALQVLKATNVALSETDRKPPDAGAPLGVLTSVGVMLGALYRAVRQNYHLVNKLSQGAVAASVTGCKRIQVTLTQPDLAQRVLQAYSSLAAALLGRPVVQAGAALQQQCLFSAGTGKLDTAVDRRMWEQFLASEHGQVLPQLLLDTGSLLCAALPTRYCCNEPSCCCIDRPSELQLAGGKGSKCSGCNVARYCGAVHQRQHWKMHKGVCRAISAAATAAAEP